MYLIGGSHPEREGNKLYNTATCYDRQGTLVAKHRKVRLSGIYVGASYVLLPRPMFDCAICTASE